jgi:hypothetical protein
VRVDVHLRDHEHYPWKDQDESYELRQEEQPLEQLLPPLADYIIRYNHAQQGIVMTKY